MNFQNSLLWRVVFSLFLAIVACGMSFYLILFLSLTASVLTHQANPAMSLSLQSNLRYIVLPLSVAAGAAMFVISMRRSGKRNRAELTQLFKTSKKPAA